MIIEPLHDNRIGALVEWLETLVFGAERSQPGAVGDGAGTGVESDFGQPATVYSFLIPAVNRYVFQIRQQRERNGL